MVGHKHDFRCTRPYGYALECPHFFFAVCPWLRCRSRNEDRNSKKQFIIELFNMEFSKSIDYNPKPFRDKFHQYLSSRVHVICRPNIVWVAICNSRPLNRTPELATVVASPIYLLHVIGQAELLFRLQISSKYHLFEKLRSTNGVTAGRIRMRLWKPYTRLQRHAFFHVSMLPHTKCKNQVSSHLYCIRIGLTAIFGARSVR